MANLPNNPDCELSGTRYCKLLNMRACSACTVRGNENMAELKKDVDLYETLLPEGGVARLFQSHECQFCKGREKGERRGYAILDMAHPEPRRVQRWIFGKRATRIGTMIPVQMAVCGRCRARFLWLDYLPVLVPTAFGFIGLFAFSLDPLKSKLMGVSAFLPFGCWAAAILVGLLLGRLLVDLLMRRWAREMYVDALAHPVIAGMTAKGWTPITPKSRTKLFFSKSRIARGLGTAEDE